MPSNKNNYRTSDLPFSQYGFLEPSDNTVQDTVPSSKGKSSSPAKQSRALKVNSLEDSNKEPQTYVWKCGTQVRQTKVTPEHEQFVHLKRGHYKTKGLYSKHYFSRDMFVFRREIGPFGLLSWTKATWTVRDTKFCKLVHTSLTYTISLPKKVKQTGVRVFGSSVALPYLITLKDCHISSWLLFKEMVVVK